MYDGAPRIGGRFNFITSDGRQYEDSLIVMEGRSKRAVDVDLLGDEHFLTYLEREDTDLTLMVRTSEGLSISDEIPFSRGALTNRYLEWELPKERVKASEEQPPAAEPGASTGRPVRRPHGEASERCCRH
jgi:hypothetical protein